MSREVLLVTEGDFLNAEASDWYRQQVIYEESLIAGPLQDLGYTPRRVAWDDASVAWNAAAGVLVRTPWYYLDHLEGFHAWLSRLEQSGARCFNDVPTLRQNLDKHYLCRFAEAGAPVVATRYVTRAAPTEAPALGDLSEELRSTQLVVKPAVSAGGCDTFIVSITDPQATERYHELLTRSDVLVQPYMERICETGEYSYIVLDGTLTHAVRKVAAKGEFRIQDDYGGYVLPHDADQEERAFVSSIMEQVPAPLYARVDAVPDASGSLQLMELELVEPELFLRFSRAAGQKLAQGLHERLSH